ncbi:alpha/beta hydrolase [Mesorhizobium sp. M0977]|uniref:alpha/beta fold hydrolase n=1 Tax=Mesorhizobium sp. M0977 TaxID=2957039 RepID=UPI003338C671
MISVDQAGWNGRKRKVGAGCTETACVEIAGQEPALVLVHGFSDTSRSFSLLAPHLAGRWLIIPDLRGHGASPAGTRGFASADFAEDVVSLIERLRLERPVLVGHSLGSMVAIEAAARYPEMIGGLVLMAGTVRPQIGEDHPMTIGVRALRDPISPADPFYDYWHACEAEVPADFLTMVAKEASAMPAALWRAILEQVRRVDLTDKARTLRLPALVIAGGRDLLFDETHQQRLLEEIPAAEFVGAARCGHNPHWEDPALVAAAIARYFKVRSKAGSQSTADATGSPG